MKFAEILRFAFHGLSANKLRSALTTLGILIGVGAVILLVAVGNGSSRQIQANIENLGTNTLTVFSGGFGRQASSASGTQSQSTALTLQNAEGLANKASAPDVYSVSPVTSTSATTTYEGSSTTATITGTYPSYFRASNSPVEDGSYFTATDVNKAYDVVDIGATVAQDLFGTNAAAVGKSISIDGSPFEVLGVLKSKGTTGITDANAIAIAPYTSVQDVLTGYGSLSEILVQATSAQTTNAADSEITAILDKELGVTSSTGAATVAARSSGFGSRSSSSQPFEVLNQSQLLSTSTSTSHTFTVLLGAVAAISLLVGGIGITNIMLVTVTERTREIGIRKAVGAPKSAILGQFLAESVLLSVFGGVLGIVAGFIGSMFTIVGVKPVIVPDSIVLAVGVSVLIGLFFGSYPANRAASMRPIEALRYE
ncbi:MAG: ABC transporter permease [Acidimicrobiales bacterium]|jgi:putative ABC transport system permease protein